MKKNAISPFAAICSDVGITEERLMEILTQKKKDHVFCRSSVETGQSNWYSMEWDSGHRDGGERTEGTGRD